MHLAGLAWNKVKQNQERLYHSLSRYGDFSQIEANHMKTESESHGSLSLLLLLLDKFSTLTTFFRPLDLQPYYMILVTLPFSHSGERFLANYTEVIEKQP